MKVPTLLSELFEKTADIRRGVGNVAPSLAGDEKFPSRPAVFLDEDNICPVGRGGAGRHHARRAPADHGYVAGHGIHGFIHRYCRPPVPLRGHVSCQLIDQLIDHRDVNKIAHMFQSLFGCFPPLIISRRTGLAPL